jgi:hypothetical protein
MDTFDIYIVVIFIILVIVTTVIAIHTNRKSKIDNKIKEILKEPFIVSDAQNIAHYDALKIEALKLPDNFNEDIIKNPPQDQVVNYEEPQVQKNTNAYKSVISFGDDKPYPSISCSNSSVNNPLKTGPMQLLPTQPTCDQPNKLTAENYYKNLYNPKAIKMDPGYVKGANYQEYTDFVAPDKINVRILSNNTKGLIPSAVEYKNIPSPNNYAFYNTPALAMP